jgi:hypothetical protein
MKAVCWELLLILRLFSSLNNGFLKNNAKNLSNRVGLPQASLTSEYSYNIQKHSSLEPHYIIQKSNVLNYYRKYYFQFQQNLCSWQLFETH